MQERPRWSVEIASKGQVESMEDYCDELLNKENPWACGLEMRPNIGPVQDMSSEEMEQSMMKMKWVKSLDPVGFQLR